MALEPSYSFGGILSGKLMETINPELISIQDEIRSAFGWALDDDIFSALELSKKCKQPKATIKFSGPVMVVGAAAKDNISSNKPIIAADGAVGALQSFENLKLVVTDCDGYPYLQKAIDSGIPLAIHAHGDNLIEWNKTLEILENDHPVILTHQTPLDIEGMSNPGGFTDGDRAVCLAFALGAESVELIGFSNNNVGKWSCETDSKQKLVKLSWMEKILTIFNLEVSDGEE
tara:strand:+ start:78 stop:770 length:693 start_codon:yes stop_codon:yes gene_type:complete